MAKPNLVLPGTWYQGTKFRIGALTIVAWHMSAIRRNPVGFLAQFGRAALRSARFIVSPARAALHDRAAVQQRLLSHAAALPAMMSPTVKQEPKKLHKWLQLPAETNMDLDVLAWWKAKDCPEELPALAKMARQYLGRPASSAGVERMFSKAGKLYDDAKKRQTDETLEAALFAAANTD